MTRSPLISSGRGSGETRLLAAVALTAFLGGIAAITLSSLGGSDTQSGAAPEATTPTASTPTPKPAKPKRVRIAVTGIGAYDPDGDRSENDGAATLATDGNLATAWTSERYRTAFAKSGVGLVVAARRPVKADRVIVATNTPGYRAEVRVGSSPEGPFVAVSKAQVTRARTTFLLEPRNGRYLMLWITSMPAGGTAAVNELSVTSAG